LIPKTIRSTLERQNLSTLFEIRDLVEHLIAEIGQPLTSEELLQERVVQKVKTIDSITYRQELVSCGKNCKGCPHGPYWYGYWREGGKTHSKYIGKNLRNSGANV
jgi:hypothetical protein